MAMLENPYNKMQQYCQDVIQPQKVMFSVTRMTQGNAYYIFYNYNNYEN